MAQLALIDAQFRLVALQVEPRPIDVRLRPAGQVVVVVAHLEGALVLHVANPMLVLADDVLIVPDGFSQVVDPIRG